MKFVDKISIVCQKIRLNTESLDQKKSSRGSFLTPNIYDIHSSDFSTCLFLRLNCSKYCLRRSFAQNALNVIEGRLSISPKLNAHTPFISNGSFYHVLVYTLGYCHQSPIDYTLSVQWNCTPDVRSLVQSG